jgi:nicotinamidase-related amidase
MDKHPDTENKCVTRHPLLAAPENVGLVVVDVQERFAPSIPGFEGIIKNVVALASGFREFGLPVVVTEQYPKGLGKTVRAVSECLSDMRAIEKTTFSAMMTREFSDRLAALGCGAFAVCGIEAHICVHQTVCDMLHNGFRVWVPWDATGSRDPRNRDLALGRMEKVGAIPTSTEMILFEMARQAGTDSFKKIQNLIK